MENDYSILIGGEAGQGSKKAGIIIGELFNNLGYNVFIYNDYQSLIRGGHNFSKIRASEKKYLTHREKIDFLLALDKKTIEEHKNELKENGLIIYNSDEFLLRDKRAIGMSIKKIKDQIKEPIMVNIALVAGLAKIIDREDLLKKIIEQKLKKKKQINIKIAEQAFEQTENIIKIKKINKKPLPLLTGNESISLGAAKAGLNLYIAYPMTPATGILHYLAEHEEELGVKISQLENEIGVISAAVGAAYTGARTMVGTSGGGFALMTETLSLAVQNEIPLVIVESQRMSPASGVPTYTAQGDLSFVLSAGHGDITKFVVAPGDADEACFWSGKIINLSWKYQTPSVLLIDKEISESSFSFNPKVLKKIKPEKIFIWDKKGKYLRYKNTKNGISPFAFPGEKNVIVKSNSYEHDEFGLTVEDEEKVKQMQDKRLRKFQAMEKEIDKLEAVKVYGDQKSEKAIITWGSTKWPAKETAEKLGFKMIQPIILEPFPEKQMKEALKGVKKIALVEVNQSAQLGNLLSRFGIKIDKKILKYNARPFVPEEIEQRLRNF